MSFVQPAWLLLLVPLALVVWHFSPPARLRGWRRMSLPILRLMGTICLLFVVAGVRCQGPPVEPELMFLLENSPNTGFGQDARPWLQQATDALPEKAKWSVLTFGDEKQWHGPRRMPEPEEVNPTQPGQQTMQGSTQRALQVAASLMPANGRSRIVLFGSGHDITGLEAQSAGLANRSLPVDVVPIESVHRQIPAITGLTLRGQATEGEPFSVIVSVHTPKDDTATLEVQVDGAIAAQRILSLREGNSQVVVPGLQAEGRVTLIRAILAGSLPGTELLLELGGKSRALVVANDRILAQSLRQQGFEVEERPESSLPNTVQELRAYDAVIVEAPSNLTISSLSALTDWVRYMGGGLFLSPSEESVASFVETAWKQLLPVEFPPQSLRGQERLAVLMLVDRSGSMSVAEHGQMRLNAAIQAGLGVATSLTPSDVLGIWAVDTQVHEILPLARYPDPIKEAAVIRRLQAGGGGIVFYESFAQALQALSRVEASLRSLIYLVDANDVLSKGMASEEADSSTWQLVDLAKQLEVEVLVGAFGRATDRDVRFLEELARRSGGTFFLEQDAGQLADLVVGEVARSSRKSHDERMFRLSPRGNWLREIDWETAPPLGGIFPANAKASSVVHLIDELERPVFSSWRLGLGQVGIWLSDLGAPGPMREWPGFSQSLGVLAANLTQPEARDVLQGQIISHLHGLELEVLAKDGDQPVNGLTLLASRWQPGTEAEQAVMQQAGPGRYTAAFKTQTGSSLFTIGHPPGGLRPLRLSYAGGTYVPTREGRQALADLARSTQGTVLERPEQVMDLLQAKGSPTTHDGAITFLCLAILIFGSEIVIRRWPWKKQEQPTVQAPPNREAQISGERSSV